jgi:hypothetical protein
MGNGKNLNNLPRPISHFPSGRLFSAACCIPSPRTGNREPRTENLTQNALVSILLLLEPLHNRAERAEPFNEHAVTPLDRLER